MSRHVSKQTPCAEVIQVIKSVEYYKAMARNPREEDQNLLQVPRAMEMVEVNKDREKHGMKAV
jgi:hypothetical protein